MRLSHKIFTTIIASFLLLCTSFALGHQSASALFENAKGEAQCGVNLADGATGTDSSCADTTNSESNLSSTLKSVLNILSVVAGVITVIMLIIAGIRFVTSQGDSGSVSSARNTVIYAIVGLIVVVLAQFIVFFVVGKTTDTGTKSETVKSGAHTK